MMEKNCRTCKHGHNVRKGVYTANYFCEQLKNNGSNGYFGQLEASCTDWQPKEAEKVEEKTCTKPPLGVMPEKIWKLKRCQDLSRAIHDYLYIDELKLDLIYNWADELYEHIRELQEYKEEDGE